MRPRRKSDVSFVVRVVYNLPKIFALVLALECEAIKGYENENGIDHVENLIPFVSYFGRR